MAGGSELYGLYGYFQSKTFHDSMIPVGLKETETANVVYCACVAIFLVLGCNIFHWQIICALCSYQSESLVRAPSAMVSSGEHLGAVSWAKCLGNSVCCQYRTLFCCFFCCCFIAYTHTHTFAFILLAHHGYHSCNKSLQTYFWSLRWLVGNGCSWQKNEPTSIPSKDFTVWSPCQI